MLALMLIAVFACTALCIDIGWAALTKSELQNAADSSAAAGAAQLVGNFSKYSIPNQSNSANLIASAQESASIYSTRFAGYNDAGGVNSLSLPSGDISFGFVDAAGTYHADYAGYPNTVQVTVRRDSTANTPLSLFVAPVLGTKKLNMSASSSATIYSGLITSFNPSGGGETSSGGISVTADNSSSSSSTFNCTLLPVAFDVNHWNQFMTNGASPDGTVHTDGAGTPQILMYPSPKNSPGNFGLLCIGHWTNNDPDYSYWILHGPTSNDIQILVNQGSFPVSMTSPKPWKGSPGLKSNLVNDFAAIIGQPRLLPLFKPASQTPYQAASGSGSNTTYNIVGFVGVKVTQASGNGKNMNVSIQPCDVIDPTAVFDSATMYPSGAAPSTQLKSFTHTSTKFTY